MDFHPLESTRDESSVSAYAHLDRYVRYYLCSYL